MVADAENYGLLLYNNQPVEQQKKVDNDIMVKFYSGKVAYVSPTDWVTNKRFASISRSHGSREHILKNWRKYSKYCVLSN